jgi:hypothetical protein
MAETMDTTTERGAALGTVAVLFALLGVSNLMKPLEMHGAGFVFLGHRLSGTPNMILGPLFGLYLLAYAAGVWRLRQYALPMGRAYAAYVVLNLVLFQIWGPKPPEAGVGFAIFGLVYAVVAIGVSSGAVYLLKQKRLT